MDVAPDLPQLDMPGGEDFHDVKGVFNAAAADMEPGSLILMNGFSLQDAMSAFEIGEPRLDSGMVLAEGGRPPFKPLTPLLPEELCWILDRSFGYEMEWHAGNIFSHTIFTLLYVHHLGGFEPDLIPSGPTIIDDPSRPQELVTVVLRSAVFGLLKCCDLAWREMSKGHVQDTEDWQSDKCDVSLIEGVPAKHVNSMLEVASTWLLRSTRVPIFWRNALRARILLRKTLLQIMQFDVFTDCTQFQALVDMARKHLNNIRSHPSPEPAVGSPALLAFDPFIARRLNTFVPIRVLEVPVPEQTWNAIDALLCGWHELSLLSITNEMSTWEVVGNLRLWLPEPPQRIPYIRSSIQSIFYDGHHILDKYSPMWMVNQFFVETLGITYDSTVNVIKQRWTGTGSPPLPRLEHSLVKLIIPHIKGLWCNPPRRRRHLMKSLLHWHEFYDLLTNIIFDLDDTDPSDDDIIMQIPNAALVWRLSTVREVVFSGFQLELYTSEEKPFAYWYASQVIEAHLSCLDNMLRVLPQDSAACREMQFQYEFLTSLQAMSIGMFSVSMPLMSFVWQRMRFNFFRRHKWAFRPEYDDIETPVVAPPEFHRFMPACTETLQDESFSPSNSFKFARSILLHLVESEYLGGWAGQWGKDRIQLIQNLASACEGLYALPTSMKDVVSFDVGLLKWDPLINSWFPCISEEGADRRRNIHVKPLSP